MALKSAFATALLAALVAAIGWFYVWTAVPEWRTSSIVGPQDGYYNLLIRGFLKGHLYLDTKPDPYLASLADPFDPVKSAGHRRADASYYRGHFYLYFGVAPAVLLFLPFRLLTGLCLDESLASPLFACAGFAVSVWLLLAVRRRHFPSTSAWLLAACVLALGLGDMMPALLRRPSFWEVPITCGYACLMAGLAALFQALHSARPWKWLLVAGTAFGLAVGSRPTYLFACPAVLLPVCLEGRGGAGAFWKNRDLMRLALAAVAPLLAIGAGLALYNFLRFGSPLEFGFRYQRSAAAAATERIFSWHYLGYNLRMYFLAPARWGEYFPFVGLVRVPQAPAGYYGVEDPYGVIPNMPFALFAFGSLLVARRGRSSGSGGLAPFCAVLAGVALVMTASVCCVGGAINRYMLDFLPTIMVLACIGLLALSARFRRGGPAGAAVAAIAWALAAYTAVFGIFSGFRHNELFRASHPALYAKVAHAFDRIGYDLDRLRGTKYGPLEMRVIFPEGCVGQIEPLVATGRSFLSDFLFVHYTGPDSVQFGLEHTSRGTFLGPPVKCEPGRVHVIRVDMGSLYPPPASPYFDGMGATEALLRQTAVQVTLDGSPALRRSLSFYDAAGPVPTIGSAGDRPGFGRPFSGRILSWRRIPDAALPQLDSPYGALRLKVILPPFTGPRAEPLVSTGETGRGDLIYVRYEAADRIAFGYDHWGVGGYLGPVVEVKPGAPQVMEIDSGPLRPPSAGGSGAAPLGLLTIRLNGRTAMAAPVPFYPCDPGTVAVAFNAIGASTASPVFTGDLLSQERVEAAGPAPGKGPYRLRLLLPAFTGARSEPLICTGEADRGDLLFLRYVAPGAIAVGYDHWGKGGPVSRPVHVDPSGVQTIDADWGALDSDDPGRREGVSRLRVRVNGAMVLETPQPYYPCDPKAVSVGINHIGASTAVGGFTGVVIDAERVPGAFR